MKVCDNLSSGKTHQGQQVGSSCRSGAASSLNLGVVSSLCLPSNMEMHEPVTKCTNTPPNAASLRGRGRDPSATLRTREASLPQLGSHRATCPGNEGTAPSAAMRESVGTNGGAQEGGVSVEHASPPRCGEAPPGAAIAVESRQGIQMGKSHLGTLAGSASRSGESYPGPCEGSLEDSAPLARQRPSLEDLGPPSQVAAPASQWHL